MDMKVTTMLMSHVGYSMIPCDGVSLLFKIQGNCTHTTIENKLETQALRSKDIKIMVVLGCPPCRYVLSMVLHTLTYKTPASRSVQKEPHFRDD